MAEFTKDIRRLPHTPPPHTHTQHTLHCWAVHVLVLFRIVASPVHAVSFLPCSLVFEC